MPPSGAQVLTDEIENIGLEGLATVALNSIMLKKSCFRCRGVGQMGVSLQLVAWHQLGMQSGGIPEGAGQAGGTAPLTLPEPVTRGLPEEAQPAK